MSKTANRTQWMKPARKSDRLDCAYLYEDGTIIASFERRLRDLDSTFRYVRISSDKPVRCHFDGRIVFHSPAILAAISRLPEPSVRASAPNLNSGSDRSRQMGIVVGNLSVQSEDGAFTITLMPDVISSGICYQPNIGAAPDWATLTTWSGSPIVR